MSSGGISTASTRSSSNEKSTVADESSSNEAATSALLDVSECVYSDSWSSDEETQGSHATGFSGRQKSLVEVSVTVSRTELSTVQKWLLLKEKDRRFEAARAKPEARLRSTKTREINNKLTDEKFNEWLQTKRNKMKAQKEHLRVEREKVAIDEEVKLLVKQTRNKEHFDAWMRNKSVTEQAKKVEIIEKREAEAARVAERRSAGVVAYTDWLKVSAARKSMMKEQRCYGITSGKLISWKC